MEEAGTKDSMKEAAARNLKDTSIQVRYAFPGTSHSKT
jgi:hypothetical protein